MKTIRILLAVTLLTAGAHGAVTPLAWYRLGENDPGAISGAVVANATADLLGARHLPQSGGPRYTNAVSTFASNRLGSVLGLEFNGTTQRFLTNALVSGAANNFGIEAWVKPATVASGHRVIAFNGNPAANGWGLYQRSNNFSGSLGGVGFVGSASAVAGTWTHLALVRNNGTNRFYRDGAEIAGGIATPVAPAGAFALAGNPVSPGTELFSGALDEVRVFTFAANQFVPGDLLFNVQQRLASLPADFIGPTNARLNGSGHAHGLPTGYWFEWGTTTNYGNVTGVNSSPAGDSGFSYGQLLSSLAPDTAHHFRAVLSNALGVVYGTNQTFRTLGRPVAQTLPASGLTQTAATLNGLANPGGLGASAWFEFGFFTNYGNVTAAQAVGSGTNSTNFSEAITGLIPGVSYHFRAVVSNSLTVVFGGDQSFPRLAQRDYVKASDTRASFGFGRSMAMSGDTLVVGGVSTYVFVRQGDSWLEQARLFASGSSVAVSGDTLVVGSPGDDHNSTTTIDAGSAFVFVRSGTTWGMQATLRASNLEAFDNFGHSVAVSGDTIVVGAPFEDSNATGVNGNQSNNTASSAGAAYVFTRSGTTWSQQAYLKASNTEADDEFGGAVTISGDTVVVGADSESSNATGINGNQNTNNASRSGAAYAFVRNGTTWSQQAYIKASNTGFFDSFGRSIAMEGNTLVVGAVEEDGNASGVNGTGTDPNSSFNAGAAYVYLRSGGVWSQQAYLKASNPGSNDLFGTSVAVSGDNIIVGAVGERSNATGVNGDGTNDLAPGAGAAYFFAREGTTWSFRDYLKASNTESNDHFGVSVAASGGFFVVGADGEDSSSIGVNGEQDNNGTSNSGAAYVFGPPLPPAPEISVSQSGTNLLHGASLFGIVAAIGTPVTRGFTIKNTGNDFLTSLTVTFDGADAAAFSVILAPVAPLAPTSNTTFTVRFAPTAPGLINATLHIASNDPDENPFNLVLSGQSLSFTRDQDGDGLNDAAEFLMEPLGFDFQASQTNLVRTLFSNANGAGLFTPSQLQALNVGAPLLKKDPNTGLFKLTIGVEKASLLTNFFPFPMSAPQTTINAEGKLEFQFTAPDNAAFFRLESR